ncbi:hypothetical protein ALTERO38_80126 [Alteromonas sp. 38]|nr:hypothetical protein ALTER154_10485 [Alteromonas sp. 154]VXC43026.1 hypothetical protein ALTERO38_80126 [Alteromonas sp. 38]
MLGIIGSKNIFYKTIFSIVQKSIRNLSILGLNIKYNALKSWRAKIHLVQSCTIELFSYFCIESFY